MRCGWTLATTGWRILRPAMAFGGATERAWTGGERAPLGPFRRAGEARSASQGHFAMKQGSLPGGRIDSAGARHCPDARALVQAASRCHAGPAARPAASRRLAVVIWGRVSGRRSHASAPPTAAQCGWCSQPPAFARQGGTSGSGGCRCPTQADSRQLTASSNLKEPHLGVPHEPQRARDC
jgi:hypothetical protein